MCAQLDKHRKRLCRVTDLPLHANSGRSAMELRASRDLLFSVSRVSGMSSTAVVLIVTMKAIEPLSAS